MLLRGMSCIRGKLEVCSTFKIDQMLEIRYGQEIRQPQGQFELIGGRLGYPTPGRMENIQGLFFVDPGRHKVAERITF
jgi:hypothetical protein